MQDRPTAAQLVRAVKEHLERDLVPAIADAKLRYHALVAAHVLGVVERELALGESVARAELARLRALPEAPFPGAPTEPSTLAEVHAEVAARNAALSASIRSGDVRDRAAVVRHLRETARGKLSIANPAYLSLPSPAPEPAL